MKQVGQTLATGQVEVLDVPVPSLRDAFVLVRNRCSVISAGTEKTKIDMGRKTLVEKARARPDLVAQVLQKVRTEGISKTLRTVKTRLNAPSPLGYSCAGVAVACGGLVENVRAGQRVACGGADFANHAEFVVVPKNLVVPIPDSVSDEEAAFATVGSIALQGVRLLNPLLGERFLVIGLGLLGQIAVQLLHANGCSVIATDLDPDLVELAKRFGAIGIEPGNDIVTECKGLTAGLGVDGVLICAGSQANSIIELSGEVCREKGRVVVVGAVSMDIPRESFFKKEISVTISRSYGPGRYDPIYEEKGVDYPIGYVRFTEQRNMAAFLELIALGKMDVRSLITHRFEVDHAKDAYALIEGKRTERYIGIILEYPGGIDLTQSPINASNKNFRPVPAGKIGLSFFGAGNYATSTLIPLLDERDDVILKGLVTSSGLSAEGVSKLFGFEATFGDLSELLSDDSLALIVTSRHDSHASAVVRALTSGKHVYVEKPLALNILELQSISAVLKDPIKSSMMVGFNRRFAPATQKALDVFKGIHSPLNISIRINAGAIDRNHWIQDPQQGGGRIIGEACHFVDLAACIASSPIAEVYAQSISDGHTSSALADNVNISLRFANGSIATIVYVSSGSAKLTKERIEIFGGGRAVVIDDFRSIGVYSGSESKVHKYSVQDKGQRAMLNAWLNSLHAGAPVISSIELLNSSLATILAVESMSIGMPLVVDDSYFVEG